MHFDDPAPLPDRLTTALQRIGLAVRSQSWQRARARGLTPTQAQILVLLGAEAEERRLGAVATALGITPATASDAVRALEQKGLVRRGRSGRDARALCLTLTAAGRRAAVRAADFGEFLGEAASQLEPDEQAAFYRGALKLIRTLQQRRQIPVSRMCLDCRFFRPNVHDDAMRPHHCALVDAPFGDAHLRIDCPDHQPVA
jgi:DNA-binding MarR family transcriptional regulator